jgi:acetyl esterase/lipase
MSRRFGFLVLAFGLFSGIVTDQARAQGQDTFDHKVDVVYGRKYGMALTMDVFTPKANANGAGVVWVVSGGWFSSHDAINPVFIRELLNRGYTVFAVVHGSQPRYTIPEIVKDMNRAVRFIRYHAKDYNIDSNRIGVTGGSAGGHLSLMLGTAADAGDTGAKDPVDQVSSRVQAVGCYYPPTDFLNYGKPGEIAIGCGILQGFKPPFDFHVQDPNTNTFVRITDLSKILDLGRQISPFYHASSDDPPTLIIHGDADKLVPIQQAEIILDKLKAAGVETKLVVKKGAQHGWPDQLKDNAIIADWFDEHLKSSAVTR